MTREYIVWMIAETYLHPGSGQALDVVDLPVAREEPSGTPHISGASMKGALRQSVRESINPDDLEEADADPLVTALFGKSDDAAGAWLIGEARLALLPMRSLSQPFYWVTCPQILRRLSQDLKRLNDPLQIQSWTPAPNGDTAYGPTNAGAVVLEDLRFEVQSFPADWVSALAEAFSAITTEDQLPELMNRLLVISDSHFEWLARHGLPVRARVRLEAESKRVETGALWYEELIPTDAVLYSLWSQRHGGKLPGGENLSDGLRRALEPSRGYLQVGGDATVGLGWVRMVSALFISEQPQSADGEASQ